jgi:GDP-L-fucose synthase
LKFFISHFSNTLKFPYVDEAARGVILEAERYNLPDPVNLGAGMEITIRDLVDLIKELTNYIREIRWDTSKPDGQSKRSVNVSLAKKSCELRQRCHSVKD